MVWTNSWLIPSYIKFLHIYLINQLLQSDLLIARMEVTKAPKKATYGSKRGHFEEAGTRLSNSLRLQGIWGFFLGEQVVGVFLLLGLPWFWIKKTSQHNTLKSSQQKQFMAGLDWMVSWVYQDSNQNPTKWAKFGRRFWLPGNIKRIDSVWELDYPVILRILGVL